MRHIVPLAFALTLAFGLLAACGSGGGAGATPTLDPGSEAGKGQKLFRASCAPCHALAGNVVLIGPPMAHIATASETRVEGMSAEEYLRESIVNPNAYIVVGFAKGTMRQDFGSSLSSEQVDQLIAFLMTLK